MKDTEGYAANTAAAIAGLAIAVMGWKMAKGAGRMGPIAGPIAFGLGMGMSATAIYGAIVKAQGIPRRQEGGPVEEGEPYMVGEAGPEVMVPTQGGTVIDNKGTQDMLGGGGTAMMGELRDAIANLSMRLDNVGQGGGGPQAPIVIET